MTTARTASQVLRDISVSERKLKRYKAARRSLKASLAALIPAVVAAVFGLPLVPLWSLGFTAPLALAAGYGLYRLAFSETYGRTETTITPKDHDKYPSVYPIEASWSPGMNVFDYLEKHLDELRDELSSVGAS